MLRQKAMVVVYIILKLTHSWGIEIAVDVEEAYG